MKNKVDWSVIDKSLKENEAANQKKEALMNKSAEVTQMGQILGEEKAEKLRVWGDEEVVDAEFVDSVGNVNRLNVVVGTRLILQEGITLIRDLKIGDNLHIEGHEIKRMTFRRIK